MSIKLRLNKEITDGLVARYKFSEASGTTIADSAGSIDLTTQGSPSFGNGIFEKSLILNGTDQFAVATGGNPFGADFTTATGVVTFKINSFSSIQVIIAGIAGYSNNYPQVYYNQSDDTLRTRAYLDGTRYYSSISNFSTRVTAGQWINLIFTLDVDEGIKTYLNNELLATANVTGTAWDGSTGNISIGALYDNTLNLDGEISDVRIFDKVLSETERETVYQDRTSIVDWRTFSIEDNVNDEVNLCYFTIKKFGDRTYTPTVGEELSIMDGNNKLFSGTLIKIDNQVNKGTISYKITAKDWTSELDRILVIDRYENQTVETIIQTIIDDYNTNVTYTNVGCTINVESIAFNKLPISKCIQLLAEQVNFSWYIDYNKDIHFFDKNTEQAPFNLSTTSANFIYDSLMVNKDNSQLRNRVVIRGGDKVATNDRTKNHTADGVKTVFNTDYKFSSKPTVLVNSVAQTVGTEHLDTTGFDCYWNFGEKYVRWDTAPTNTHPVEITAKPYIPIIVQVEDGASISNFGAYEFLKIDKSIKSSDEAKQFAQAQLDHYGQSMRNGNFRTETAGLVSGQTIEVNIPSRGLADTFVIQRVTAEMKSPTDYIYSVELALLRDIGIIKFLQNLIINETKQIVVDENEVLEKAYYINEQINVTEEITVATPRSVIEDITVTEDILKDPFGADTPPDFVLAPYTPTSNTDPKREFALDRSRLG